MLDSMWVDEAQFEDRLIEAMTRPLTGPGSASTPAPLLVAYPPIEWVPAGEEEGVAVQELLMLRMINDKGSILHFGTLRSGWGFSAESGFGWSSRHFDENGLAGLVRRAELDGYHLDFGPVSFPITDVVAASVAAGRFAVTSMVLLDGFADAGAPNI